MTSDILHDLKTQWDLPGAGTSERLESAAKSITPALGLVGASAFSRRWARNLGAFLESHGLTVILKNKDVPWQIGLNQHMFFFDDTIINAVILLGCGIAVISNFDLILPFAAIGIVYFGSDKFFKTVERL